MKKKYILGSAIVALLMLVSTQIVILNTVRSSDPAAHEGDADVGDLWISELDVSSELTTIDYIGISHANATDDWVFWTDGNGNINASWDVDIGDRPHPEYYVVFCLVIFNVDDDCKEIGNDSFSKTYTAGLGYDESGTLSASVSFTQQQQQAGSQTLVCYISGLVKINDTTEAENFTVWADDRSIIAVDFADPGDQPLFPTYRAEANNEFPNHMAWIDGWDEGGRFENEDEMLNTQTGCSIGNDSTTQQQYNHTWDMGNITVRIPSVSWWYLIFDDYDVEQLIREWSLHTDNNVHGTVVFNYTINNNRSIPVPIHFVIRIKATEPLIDETMGRLKAKWTYADIPSGQGHIYRGVKAHNDTRGNDDYIDVNGRIWVFTVVPLTRRLGKYGNYQIHINESVNQTWPSATGDWYWESSVAYQNLTSSSLSVNSSIQSGITTVEVDISDVLDSSNECIYSFAADRGDMRITFTC